MSDDNKTAEAKLHKLAERLRQGWAVRYPVSEKTLAAVRQVVKEQWEQEQRQEQSTAGDKSAAKSHKERQARGPKKSKQPPPPLKPKKKSQQQSPDHDWRHSH